MKNREYRNFEITLRSKEERTEEDSYLVEGYASTFKKYLMWSFDGVDYYEQIDPKAFDGCDMSDVVFRVDHEGMVYARTKAGTVELSVDDKGLFTKTDLSKTADARNLFEHIEAGDYYQMSFAFTVPEGGDEYDEKTHTRTIRHIDKLYDVSPVSFPANPDTDIAPSARDFFHGVMEKEKAERLEAERRELRKKKLQLRKRLLLATLGGMK